MSQETFSPQEIARYFLERSDDLPKEGLTPMQINKLVFLAHGWHLGIEQKPLINEKVQAWKYGPIVESIYHNFKGYGKKTVPSWYNKFFDRAEFDENTEEILKAVWNCYKDYTGLDLSTITHRQESPWYQIWEELNGKMIHGAIIDEDLIRSYYKKKYDNLPSK